MRFQPTFQCVNEVCETLLGNQENIPKDVFFLIWNSISYEERVIRDEESMEFIFADFETRGSNKRHKKGKRGRRVSKEFRLRWIDCDD